MPVRLGRCVNFALCPKADAHEVITVHNGEEFNCPFPECREPLQPLKRKWPWPVVGLVAALLLTAFGIFRWQSSRPPALPPTPALTQQATPLPIKAEQLPGPCQKMNWVKANESDLLTTNCVGKGIAAYNERLDYVYALERVKNWSSVRRDDPRLLDCAGIHPCEQRAHGEYIARGGPEERKAPIGQEDQKIQKVRKEEVTANWSKASCEQIRGTWEPEDPRLSTATCGGLSEDACAHIERCLGLHPVSVGPGSSKSQF